MAIVATRSVARLRERLNAHLPLRIVAEDADGEVVLLWPSDVATISGVCEYPPLPSLMAAAMAWATNHMAAAFQLHRFLEAVIRALRVLPTGRWQDGSVLAVEVIFMLKAAFRPYHSWYKGRRVSHILTNSRWHRAAIQVGSTPTAFHELLALRNKLAQVITDLESALHSLAAAEVLINRKTVAGSQIAPHDALALNGANFGLNKHARPGSPIANALYHVACNAVYVTCTDRDHNMLSFLFQTASPVATECLRYTSDARKILKKFFKVFPPPCHDDACEFLELADAVQYMIGICSAHVMADEFQPSIPERCRTIHFSTGHIITTM